MIIDFRSPGKLSLSLTDYVRYCRRFQSFDFVSTSISASFRLCLDFVSRTGFLDFRRSVNRCQQYQETPRSSDKRLSPLRVRIGWFRNAGHKIEFTRVTTLRLDIDRRRLANRDSLESKTRPNNGHKSRNLIGRCIVICAAVLATSSACLKQVVSINSTD